MKNDFIKNVLYGKEMIQGCKDSIHEGIQGILLNSLLEVFYEEVDHLCGPKHHPKSNTQYKRAGSAIGRVYLEGLNHSIKKPRVRSQSGSEVKLKSYENAKSPRKVLEDVFRAFSVGVSSRDIQTLHPNSKGFSKSEVNRKWVANSIRYLEELRNRPLNDEPLLAMMMDGIVLSDDLTAIIALGIYPDGHKRMLDFEIGAYENKSICTALIQRIKNRGVYFGGTPFFILDGSDALEQSVSKSYQNPIIQRCLVHKESNLKYHLSRKDHPELKRLMKRLRMVQGSQAGRNALLELRTFLSKKSKQALNSLDEAGDSLIALHLLNVPSTLNISLLSTNCIENSIKNFRRKTARVTRWRPQSDMSERWTAYAMLSVEQGFRKIKGYKDISKLLKALNWKFDNKKAA